MCMTRSSYEYNNKVPLSESQKFSNRKDSFLPTPRGRIDNEILKNPIKILKDSAFANEKLPKW